MSKRACSGCGALIPAGTRGGRCPTCERQHDRARGTRQQRGYDAAHDQLRAEYQRAMDQGQHFTCWRCDKPIDPKRWHLGHNDHDRTRYEGPECPACNLSAAAQRISPHA